MSESELPATLSERRKWPKAVLLGAAALLLLAAYIRKHNSHELVVHTLSDGSAVKGGSGLEIRELIPEASAPVGDKIEQFDMVFGERMIVRKGAGLYDFGDGARLSKPDEKIESFAALEGGGAIAVIASGKLGFWSDAGVVDTSEILEKSKFPYKPSRLLSDDNQTQLFLIGEGADPRYLLARIKSQSALEVLTGSPNPISFVTAVGDQVVFGITHENRTMLFELMEPGKPRLLIALEPISGLAALGKDLFFSNEHGIHRLRGDAWVTAVSGLGGPLRASREELIVLDSRRGRPYAIKGL